MKRRYKYRAYPDGGQCKALSRLFGCVRFTYNQAIAAARNAHAQGLPYPGVSMLDKHVLTLGKAEHLFLREVSSIPLQQAVRDADRAYRNFFDSVTGKRKGRRVGPPRFKSKRDRTQSARFTGAATLKTRATINPRWREVYLPKVGWVSYRDSRPLPSQPSSVTVRHLPDDTWELSFVIEVEEAPTPDTARLAGIDLGLTDFASIVYSDGTREKVPAPRHLRSAEKRLARAQRSLSRKKKGSRNRDKARLKVAKIHSKVARQRLDHAHKLSTRLARENQAVAVESLSITGLARTRLAKSVHDAGWGQFLTLLSYKTTVAPVDRWFPSSQACSVCGVVSGKKPLSVREWVCPSCGAHLDRDYNAAVNIMVAAGLAETVNACGGSVRLRLAGAEPVKQEPAEQTGAHDALAA